MRSPKSRSKLFALALTASAIYLSVTPAFASPGVLHPKALLTHPGFKTYAAYATSVALSGDGSTSLVGAPQAGGPGKAYVFTGSATHWKSQAGGAVLSVAGLLSSSYFGYSVSLNSRGNIAVVGAYNATSSNNQAVPSAYVFVRPKSGWKSTATPKARLTFPGDEQGSGFGISVTISTDGKTIVVGADSTNLPHGEAYVFQRPASGWKTTAIPSAALSDPNGDYMGYTTSLSANGAQALIGTNTAPGAVFVFSRSASGWTTMTHATAQLSVQGISADAQYGYSVSMSGDGRTAAVSSLQDPGGFDGRVYIFTRVGTHWASTGSPKAHLSYADSGDFGNSIAIDATGDAVLVGQGSTAADPRETAYVFGRPATGWKTSVTPDSRLMEPSATAYESAFGYAVSMRANGKVFLAGAADRGNAAVFSN